MATFGTVEVYEEMARGLVASGWAEVGADLCCSIVFAYKAPIDKGFLVRFDGGRIPDVHEVPPSGEPSDLVVTASPKTWRGLIEGRSPMIAMSTGKVKVDGDLGALMQHVTAFHRIFEALSAVQLA